MTSAFTPDQASQIFLHHSPGRAVCVVESDEAARAQIVETLAIYGCHVHEASTAAAALEIAARIPLSLALVNVVLPDMSGLGLIKRLRDQSSSISIIAISDGGNSNLPLFLELAHYAGANATLTAPVSALELCAAVRLGLGDDAPSTFQRNARKTSRAAKTPPLPKHYETLLQPSSKLQH